MEARNSRTQEGREEGENVYFSDDENVISIESHSIDGIIFANDIDYGSYD